MEYSLNVRYLHLSNFCRFFCKPTFVIGIVCCISPTFKSVTNLSNPLAKIYPKYTWLKDIKTVINVSPYIVKGENGGDDDYDEEGSGFNEHNNNI